MMTDCFQYILCLNLIISTCENFYSIFKLRTSPQIKFYVFTLGQDLTSRSILFRTCTDRYPFEVVEIGTDVNI